MKAKTKKQRSEFIQQGDVLIFGTTAIPASAKRLATKTLREGEHTGHAHVATADDVTLFIEDGTLFMSAPSGTTVVHEEHNLVDVPPGNYRIGAVREFDYLADMSREVLD